MRLDWTRLLMVLSTAVMEGSWVYILLYVLAVRPVPDLSEPVLSTSAVLGLLLGGLFLGAVQEWLGLRGKVSRAVLIALALFAALWTAKGGATGHYGLLDGESWLGWARSLANIDHPLFLRNGIGLVAALLLLWRGMVLQRLEIETPARSFRIGLVVSAFFILIGSLFLLDIESAGPSLVRAISAFFFFGLLAVAVAQLRRGRAGSGESPGTRWFLVLLPTVAGILAIGILITSLFSPQLGEFLQNGWEHLVADVLWLLTPLIVAVYALGQLVTGLIPRSHPAAVTPESPVEVPPSPMGGPQPTEPWIRIDPRWGYVVTGVVLALLVAGVAYWIWLLLSHSRFEDEENEERESLWVWDEVGHNLQDWLRRLRRPVQRADLRALLDRLQGPPTTVAIRRLYIRLLLLALEQGVERRAGQTPHEYLHDLRQAMPQTAPHQAALTEAYVYARYDPHPASPDLVRRAETAWEQILRLTGREPPKNRTGGR
ncbi:MAG: DUF4129 domain-containing protein [Chloroflexia bacterium]